MTERLYFDDSYLWQFEGHVIGRRSIEGRPGVVLDRTAFYPTGGGQPNDLGTLLGVRVVDVVEPEEGEIVHVLESEPAFCDQDAVTGEVDGVRRLDHIQQHTGQHVLSAAFEQLFDAETKAFRMGVESSEIDVEIEDPDGSRLAQAEELANEIVFRDLPVRIHMVDREGASRLPLRKQNDRDGELRVIEIEGFDWNPCGGTHGRRTGEIGLIAVRNVERAKRLTRIEFVCGRRALDDYRRANRATEEIGRVFSTGRSEGPAQVRRLFDEAKQLRKRVRELSEIASEVEGRRMYADGVKRNGFRIVASRLDGRTADEIRLLAHKILAEGPAVALLASDDAGTARLVFARSDVAELAAVDCGAMLRAACEVLGGRGGGRPDMAQGGGPDASRIDEALAAAMGAV